MQQSGIIYDIQRSSHHDGPGNRATLCLKGCPLHCWWCPTPESQTPHCDLVYDETLCLYCEACEQVCPECGGHLVLEARSDPDVTCIRCQACARVCPSGAISVLGQETT